MKSPSKVGAAVALLVLAYIVGLFGGLYALCYAAGGWKRDDLESYAKLRMIEYTNGGTINNWNNGGIAAVIYDENGKFQDFFRENGDPFIIEFVLQSENAVPTVLSGETSMRLSAFVQDYSKLGYTSYLYIGLPLRTDGAVDGAFFWVKELPDLTDTLIMYAIIMTVIFLAFAVFIAVYFRMQRKYETMRSKYIDNITHELKSPIASIRALAEALTDRPLQTESQRNSYYGMIIGEANRQEKMIVNVLKLSKLQSSPTMLQKWRVDAAEIFDPIREKHEAMCEMLGVDFQVAESVLTLPALSTNPQTIIQVLEIILSNARKFVPEDGRISISATVQRRSVTICVTDNGVGVPKEEQSYVFERFYKGSQRSNDTGSGLGLAIAKESLAVLGEKIWLSSEENRGTSVFFTIARA